LGTLDESFPLQHILPSFWYSPTIKPTPFAFPSSVPPFGSTKCAAFNLFRQSPEHLVYSLLASLDCFDALGQNSTAIFLALELKVVTFFFFQFTFSSIPFPPFTSPSFGDTLPEQSPYKNALAGRTHPPNILPFDRVQVYSGTLQSPPKLWFAVGYLIFLLQHWQCIHSMFRIQRTCCDLALPVDLVPGMNPLPLIP